MAINLSVNALKVGALKNAGEMTDGTSQYDANALDYLNKAHLAVLSGSNEFEVELSEPFSWAKEPMKGTLILQPNYQAGSATFTNSQVAITFSLIPVNQNGTQISLAGYWIQRTGVADWFRIATHVTGSLVATLDAAFTGDTVAGASFNAVPLEYTLSPTDGILRLISPLEVYQFQDAEGDQEGKVYFTDEVTLLRECPMFLLRAGTPTKFAIISKDNLGNFKIRFNKYVLTQTKVEYNWIKIPAEFTDSITLYPNVPVDHRLALQYMTTYWLCVDKNDSRKQDYFNLTKNALKAMIAADCKEKTQASKNRGRLIPRGDNFSQGRRYITQGTS